MQLMFQIFAVLFVMDMLRTSEAPTISGGIISKRNTYEKLCFKSIEIVGQMTGFDQTGVVSLTLVVEHVIADRSPLRTIKREDTRRN